LQLPIKGTAHKLAGCHYSGGMDGWRHLMTPYQENVHCSRPPPAERRADIALPTPYQGNAPCSMQVGMLSLLAIEPCDSLSWERPSQPPRENTPRAQRRACDSLSREPPKQLPRRQRHQGPGPICDSLSREPAKQRATSASGLFHLIACDSLSREPGKQRRAWRPRAAWRAYLRLPIKGTC
jgi:hypothetical protein